MSAIQQTNAIVISISQQRETVTLFVGQTRYQLDAIADVLAKTNQALATLETVLDEKLVARSATLGEEMKQRLRAMQEKYEFLGDVRGVGLLIGLDLVKDRKTKEPLARPVTERIFLECLRRGLLLMGYMPRVRINPPLTITREEMDQGLGILDEVFAEVARDRSYR
jgi:4-aminobutyrate aminotransferase/(S)-3-amino-2-methylpropionate transaminase